MANVHRALLPLLVMAAAPGAADAAEARRTSAGNLPDGQDVAAITLKAGNGMTARILAYGATLQSVLAPDRKGHLADVLLGYDDLAGYVDHPNFFGVTVGRYANRIAGGKFTLDSKDYQLPLNDHGQSLHGGGRGFDKVLWQVVSVQSGTVAKVVLRHISPDGDSGYPGTLTTTLTYSLDEHGHLTIDYAASTDRPTIVNLTNHALFNLAGEGSPGGAMNHRLQIPAATYTPVDDYLIPTGELRKVAGSVFDFRSARVIAQGLRDGHDPQIVIGKGYDHNFALDAGATSSLHLAARLTDPASGRTLDVLSAEPGLQFYTGNFLDGSLIGKHGHVYRMGDGIALEPQKFPDAPNQPKFVSARVDPGKPYHHTIVFHFSAR